VNPGSAPEWIGAARFADEVDGAWGDGLPPDSTRSTFPSPEQAEAGAMPSDHRIGLNPPKGRPPRTPGLGEPGPKSSVQRCQFCSFGATAQDEQLVPQGQIPQEQVPTRFHRRGGEGEEQDQPNNLAIQISAYPPKRGALSARMALLPTTGVRPSRSWCSKWHGTIAVGDTGGSLALCAIWGTKSAIRQ